MQSRTLLLAHTLAGLVGLSLLMSACGSAGSHVAQLGSNAAATDSERMLAFSGCVRDHGVPNFPDPDSEGNIPSSTQQALGVSKQTMLAADEACKRLLPSGGGGSAGTRGDQQKLAFALKVARCMRTHGFPTYPDPANPSPSSQGSGTRFEGTGIDTKSARFQTTEMACEKQAREALGLP